MKPLKKSKKSNKTQIKCPQCKKFFETTYGRIRQGSGKFCSNECRWDYIKSKRIIHKCLICDKTFSTTLARKDAKFCSEKCKRQSYKNKYIRNKCGECGEFFEKLSGRVKLRKGEFCSTECYNKNRQLKQSENKVQVVCLNCGKNIKIYPIKIDKVNGNFCSRNCHMKYRWKTKRDQLIKYVRSAIKSARLLKLPTKIEVAMEASLIKLKCNFTAQKWIYGKEYYTCVDFFIKPNICLYVDGIYWHDPIKNPMVFKRDKRINRGLKKDGYKVFRLSEKIIKRGEKEYLSNLIKIIKN